MKGVIRRLAPSNLPAAAAAGSFLGIIILVAASNPVDKISYAMIFFLLLFIFLVATGHLIIARVRGQVTARNRYKILIISIFLVVLLMFRSSQSLGWLESLVLLAVMGGLLFYSGRRS